MKKWNLMAVFAALCMLIPAFAGCDKEDPTNGDAIKGTYTGTLGYNVAGFEPGNIDGEFEVKILIDADDSEKVTVVLPECSFTPPIPNARPFSIPSLTAKGVSVTVKDTDYTFSKSDFSLTADGKDYTGRNLTGTISGKTIKELHYNVSPGSMPMDIAFTFTGTKK